MISAVGHETDFTIADFVADVRAPDAVGGGRAGGAGRGGSARRAGAAAAGGRARALAELRAPRARRWSACAGVSAIRAGCSTSGGSASTSRSSAGGASSPGARNRARRAAAGEMRLNRAHPQRRIARAARRAGRRAPDAGGDDPPGARRAAPRIEAAGGKLGALSPLKRARPRLQPGPARRRAPDHSAADVAPGERMRVRLREGSFAATVDAPRCRRRPVRRQGFKMIRAAVLGADVSQSRSPAIHNAAFRALGIEGEYVALSVTPRGFPALVAKLRANGLSLPERHDPAQGRGGGTWRRTWSGGPRLGGRQHADVPGPGSRPVRAENTDGAGLIAALHDLALQVAGKTIVMVGAGGAAAGAVEALTRAGARVRIVARRVDAARALQRRLVAPQQERVTVAPWTADALAEALTGADALVSAVPAPAWAATEGDARGGWPRSTPRPPSWRWPTARRRRWRRRARPHALVRRRPRHAGAPGSARHHARPRQDASPAPAVRSRAPWLNFSRLTLRRRTLAAGLSPLISAADSCAAYQ